jgi:hypothetical protein
MFVCFYEACALSVLYGKGNAGKFIAAIAFVLLTASGIVDIMVVKNDFHFPVADAPQNTYIQWIKDNTDPKAVFLAKQELYDPVVLAGRRNYFGHTYYTSVMGYSLERRGANVKKFFESPDAETFSQMRSEGISYIAIPIGHITDFPYIIREAVFLNNLRQVFSDGAVRVYSL